MTYKKASKKVTENYFIKNYGKRHFLIFETKCRIQLFYQFQIKKNIKPSISCPFRNRNSKASKMNKSQIHIHSLF